MLKLIAIGLVIASSIIGAFASLLLKYGSKKFSRNLIVQMTNWPLIFGLGLYGFAACLFIVALQWGELSILYPLVSLTYIWVAIVSRVFLNEKMNKFKLLAILLIIAGVAIIGLGM